MKLSNRSLATLFLTVAFCSATMVVLVPSIAADRPGIGATLFLIAGLFFTLRAKALPRSRLLWWVIIPPAVLLVPMVTIARSFRRLDMVSLIFHTQMGVADAGVDGLETEILQAVLATLFLLVVFWALARLWGLGRKWVFAMAAYLLAINPVVAAIVLLATSTRPDIDLTEDLRFPVSSGEMAQPADLLMIYLEGTDAQFADPAIWGDAYAPLSEIAAGGLTFSRVGQMVGTGWSLAGMTATQCGLPILPRGLLYRANFHKSPDFMPMMTCLGDLMAEHGYYSAYVVGGPLEFGGLDLLFRTHGYSEAIGRDELIQRLPRSETNSAVIGWMLDDQLVFEYSADLHEKMASQPKPFALVIETMGPHGRKAFMSRNCAEDGRAQFSTDFDRVLRCTINDTAAFVALARERQAALRPGRPLLVVLVSDHLNHNAELPTVGPEFAGFNTVILAGAGLPAGQVVSKPGAMIDVYPTILQAMDLSKPPFEAGLGRSLLSDAPTLVETYGLEELEPMVVLNRRLAKTVWRPDKHPHFKRRGARPHPAP